MKRSGFMSFLLLLSLAVAAQTQQGYVKTRGRMGTDGKVVAGVRLPGAAVKLQGQTAVVSGANGTFELAVRGRSYLLQSVQKQGYVLTDPDMLNKEHRYSPNPLVLVLDDMAAQDRERRAIKRSISNAFNTEIEKKNKEIEALREQQKITDERYEELLRQLNKYEDENERIVEDLVERYSRLDFDQLDDFERQFSTLIANGRVEQADSLLKTQGNAKELIEEVKAGRRVIAQMQHANEQKSDKAARMAYHTFELYKIRHQNDSAAAILKKRLELEPENVEWLIETGQFLLNYMADYQGADDCFERALDAAKRQHGEQHALTAAALNALGIAAHEQGQLAASLDYFRKALDIRERLYGEDHPEVATCHKNIGNVLEEQSRRKEALGHMLKALDIDMRTEGANSLSVADDYNFLAGFYREENQEAKAWEYYQKALATRLALLGKESTEVAEVYNNMAGLLKDQDSLAAAVGYYEKALEITKTAYGDSHPDVGTLLDNIGTALYNQGCYGEALEKHQQGLAIRLKAYGEMHPNTATSYSNIAAALTRQGKLQEALDNQQKALEIDRIIIAEKSGKVAQDYANIASILQEAEMNDDAIGYFQKSLSIAKEVFGNEENDLAARCYNAFGAIYVAKKDLEHAKEYMLKALELNKKLHGENHSSVALSYNNLANTYQDEGNYDQALDHFQKALGIYKSIHGEEHPAVANCYSNIGVNYYCQKDYPQALEYLNKSIAIKEKTEVAPDNLAEIYSFRASIEEKSGNQPAALESYMKSYALLLTVKSEDDMDLARAFYAVYNTFLQLTQGQQADIFRQRFHAFMADKVFCGVVQEGGPAHRAGLSGTFVYLAFNGEPVNAGGFEKNFFQIVGQAREQPKTVVAERDGTIMEKHFDGPLGCMNMVRTIAPAEKQALLQRYEQWKAAGQQ